MMNGSVHVQDRHLEFHAGIDSFIYVLANGTGKIKASSSCQQHINCFEISGNEKGKFSTRSKNLHTFL